MDLAEYKPEAICRALGLDGFYTSFARGAPKQELRVLFRPSFHPEVCVTFFESDGDTKLALTCAQNQIWHLNKMNSVATHADVATLAPTILAELEAAFRQALAQTDSLSVTIDGMGVDVFWRTFDRRLVLEGANPSSEDSVGKFVARLVKLAFEATDSIPCKDSLARAAYYVGLDLPLSDPVETKPTTRLAVLGSAEERAQVLAALKATQKGKS